MKCVIFGLTGMGNAAVRGCLRSPLISELLVFTRSERGPFPHYPCEELKSFCFREAVPYHADLNLKSPDTVALLKAAEPDIIIVATFDQIIPDEILKLPKRGIYNIHPSLLPKYRGPTPTNWTILNGEQSSGITVHEMTSRIDIGRVLLQQSTEILGRNDGQLRQHLARMTEDITPVIVEDIATGKPLTEMGEEGSYQPNFNSPAGHRMLEEGHFDMENVRRAYLPYPGLEALPGKYGTAAPPAVEAVRRKPAWELANPAGGVPSEGHVRICPFSKKHLAKSLGWVNEPSLMSLMLRVLPVSWADQRKWYDGIVRDPAKMVFAIHWAADGTHIGNTGLYSIDLLHRRAEFWILIGDKAYWNKGAGREATAAIQRFAFEQLGLNRLYLHVGMENHKAKTLYLDLGFKVEGILREHYYIRGQHIDVALMSQLKEEYDANK